MKFLDSAECRKKAGNIDGAIFFTDGYPFDRGDSLYRPKCPLMWAITEGGPIPADWGYSTEIIIREK